MPHRKRKDSNQTDNELEDLLNMIQEQAQHTDTLREELSMAAPRTIERLHDFFASCQKAKSTKEK